jgi:uncharacterized membrane protein YkvA (DUF1232 family)
LEYSYWEKTAGRIFEGMDKQESKLPELDMKPGETQEEYVERTLWTKIKQTAARVPFVPDAVAMYYTVRDAKTPFWARATILAALAYFVLPADTIPDILPFVGFSDDAGAIAAALAAVSAHMTDEHREKARQALKS